jgi:hypothetical protein
MRKYSPYNKVTLVSRSLAASLALVKSYLGSRADNIYVLRQHALEALDS